MLAAWPLFLNWFNSSGHVTSFKFSRFKIGGKLAGLEPVFPIFIARPVASTKSQ